MLVNLSGTPAYWGVDSISRASTPMEAGVLFDYVTKTAGAMPSFWGRYLNYDGTNDLNKKEADFIFSHSKSACRILPIYLIKPPGDLQGAESAGVHHAHVALALAADLAVGVPEGVALYADIEPSYKVSKDWIMGWWKTMASSGYAGRGGLYVNPLWPILSKPYCDALAQWNKEQNPATPAYLYSQQPQQGCRFPPALNFAWQPAEPDCAPGSAMVWQYQIHCFDTPHWKGWGDLDLATPDGYDLMWAGPDALPVTRLATATKGPRPNAGP